MKHHKIVLIACSGIITAVCIGGSGLIGKKVLDNGLFAPSCAANQLTTADKVQQQAESITVKVFSGNSGGSGTLIAKQGQVYTVVTNQHVLTPGEPYRIQTPDGRIYPAEVVKKVNFARNDVALLQFSSFSDNYAVASLATSSTLAVDDEVFDKAILLKPDFYQAWYAQGLTLSYLVLSEEAIEIEFRNRLTQLAIEFFELAHRLHYCV